MYMINGMHELAKGKAQDFYHQADAQRAIDHAGKDSARKNRRTSLFVILATLLPHASRKRV